MNPIYLLIAAVVCDSAIVITVGLKLKGWAEHAVKEGVDQLLEDGTAKIMAQIANGGEGGDADGQ